MCLVLRGWTLLVLLYVVLPLPYPIRHLKYACACCFREQVESVRQAASKTLVSLATDVSSVLVVALGGLCQRVNNVLNTNRPSLAVRTNLLELLVRS